MNLYLDDDIASPRLAQELRRAGHDVRTPGDAGLSGAPDSVHFRRAVNEGRIILSRNYGDFRNLHFLIIEAGGHHPGVLAVRRDDLKGRNMKWHEIARALHKLETAGAPIADVYDELNHWR